MTGRSAGTCGHQTNDWQTDAVILLFHQGGSNARAEYASIIPILRRQQYSVVSIDERRGGSRSGGTNRTAEYLGNVAYTYCDAYLDLDATLKYVVEAGFDGKIIACGSSYSATLAIQLAARNSDRDDAGLAFSPAGGEPMDSCTPEQYADAIRVPLLALRPASEMEIESFRNQLATFKNFGHETFVSENGVHGSSMLNPQRTKAPTDDTWKVVLDFISRVIAD